MAGESHLVTFFALALTFIGLGEVVRGLRLYRNPALLRRDSFLYRWVYWRYFSWGQGANGTAELTERQIGCFAIGGVGVGVIMFVLGVAAILLP
jgi:hypothetical protein